MILPGYIKVEVMWNFKLIYMNFASFWMSWVNVKSNKHKLWKRTGSWNKPTHLNPKTAVPTRLGGVRAVCLGERSRARSCFAWVLLLTRTPSPVVQFLAVRLLASSEHAHWPPCLFHHVHNTIQHLDDHKEFFYKLRFFETTIIYLLYNISFTSINSLVAYLTPDHLQGNHTVY